MNQALPISTEIDVLERSIAGGDNSCANYWQLGLAYLLAGQELEAQATWFIPIGNAVDAEAEAQLMAELIDTLERIGEKEYADERWHHVNSIAEYAIEFGSNSIATLCQLIVAKIELDCFELADLERLEVIDRLQNSEAFIDDLILIQRFIFRLWKYASTPVLEAIKAIIDRCPGDVDRVIGNLLIYAQRYTHQINCYLFTIKLLEFCLEKSKLQPNILRLLSSLYTFVGQHDRSIAVARQHYSLISETDSIERINGIQLILSSLLSAANWREVPQVFDSYINLIQQEIDRHETSRSRYDCSILQQSTFFLPYLQDRAAFNRHIHNSISKILVDSFKPQDCEVGGEKIFKPSGVLRIGYVGKSFLSHSVGWLCRWLWQYHDRDRFQVFTYAINQNPDHEFHQKWFRDRSDVSYCFSGEVDEIIARIKADEIDILVDVDSLTLDFNCQILAAKPAPIQLTWLGWDATGISTVDYFIADRYVLPDDADEYYQETIWRMPGSYLGVDGFEVGIPTLKRANLNIPDDAVIYWSGQIGLKRHPDTIRLQLEIIKRVPNSYLLLKGKGDRQIIANLFSTIAAEVGVSMERLRFIDDVRDEATHRANLGVADIVLDTFPYNGATTTLETLWMGVPIVTKVGEQFSARNSYTFMKNVGLEEGIAWTDEEYINWGVQLGTDPQLRAKIHARLMAARHTSDLWNGRKFTQQMEDAYRQMWEIYQSN
jgi:predicted O-linked N-acetylglucosamine transferase (SPINDLY family)